MSVQISRIFSFIRFEFSGSKTKITVKIEDSAGELGS